MANIENRSRTKVTVKHHPDLTRTFPHYDDKAAEAYLIELRSMGLKPIVEALDDAFLVRFSVNGKRKSYTARTADEAIAIQQRIESEQHHGLFVDYTEAHRTTFADLLIRYLKDEAPRKKGFLVIAYQINMWLQDAGLERQDIAAIHAAHPNPKEPDLHIPKPTGRRMSLPCDAVDFVRKPFAKVQPEDFHEYIDERLQSAEAPTVGAQDFSGKSVVELLSRTHTKVSERVESKTLSD